MTSGFLGFMFGFVMAGLLSGAVAVVTHYSRPKRRDDYWYTRDVPRTGW